MKIEKFSDFVYSIDNVLTESFCKQVIDKYEYDTRQTQGMYRVNGEDLVIPELKKCTELYVTNKDDWRDEDDVLYGSLDDHLGSYLNHIRQYFTGLFQHGMNNTGFNIKKYRSDDDYYHWHHDAAGDRQILCIWYLNDNFEDGETELIDGTKIKPKCGRLTFVPATWNFIHRGIQPKNGDKYIITTWVEPTK